MQEQRCHGPCPVPSWPMALPDHSAPRTSPVRGHQWPGLESLQRSQQGDSGECLCGSMSLLWWPELEWAAWGHWAKRIKGMRVAERWHQRWLGESCRETDRTGKSWVKHWRQRKGDGLKGRPKQVWTQSGEGNQHRAERWEPLPKGRKLSPRCQPTLTRAPYPTAWVVGGWTSKMWSVHVVGHYSASKRKEILTPARAWTDLEGIMLCERNQTCKIAWFHL